MKLLEPIKVGTIDLRNRIVMPPMRTAYAAPNGAVTKQIIDYYAERAKGGVGLIVVEHSYIDNKESRGGIGQLGVYSDHLIPGLNELAEAIENHGAKAVLQINHAGRQSANAVIEMEPVAPSAIPCKVTGSMPRELTLGEIEEIIEAFGKAGMRAKKAGFNGVEIHGGHGYLVGEFLSPYTNKRNDKYGGSFERRARFPLEVVERVREKTGTNFVVGYRMSADECVEGGLNLEETTKFAKILEGVGIDYVHVSAGIAESMQYIIQPTYLPRGVLIHLAEAIKRVVTIPVIGVGSIDVKLANKILEEGKADLVAMGRALIADPDLPKKAEQGRLKDIRPCIRCLECRLRLEQGRKLRCAVNATVGSEGEEIKTSEKKKKVLIVGGGVAGMEAARVAALRGHKVILYEREPKLGGHLIEASIPQFKKDLRELMLWFSRQLEKLGVEIHLGIEVTPELVKKIEPDTLILAVGSEPIIPDVPGITKPIVTTAVDVLLGKTKVEKVDEVVIVGGGLVGCETALYLAESAHAHRITIVEMLDEIAIDVSYPTKLALLERLKKQDVMVLTGIKLEEIKENSIIGIDKKWRRHNIKADKVVLAIGLKPRAEVVKALEHTAPQVYTIGDCARPQKIIHAIADGLHIARKI